MISLCTLSDYGTWRKSDCPKFLFGTTKLEIMINDSVSKNHSAMTKQMHGNGIGLQLIIDLNVLGNYFLLTITKLICQY